MSSFFTFSSDFDVSQRDKSVSKTFSTVIKTKAKITKKAVSSVKQTALKKTFSSKINDNVTRFSDKSFFTKTISNNSINISQKIEHTILDDTVGKLSLSGKSSQITLTNDTDNKSFIIENAFEMKAKDESLKTIEKSISNKIDKMQNKMNDKSSKKHNEIAMLSEQIQKINNDDSRLQKSSLTSLNKRKSDDLDDEFDNIHSSSRTHLSISSNSDSRRISELASVATSHNQSTTADIGTFSNVVSQTARYFGSLVKTEEQTCEELNIWARRFYFVFLFNTIVDESMQRVFSEMKFNHKTYKFMKHRVMRLYKNWKIAVIKAAEEFFRRWIEQNANDRNLSDLVTFKNLKRELNCDFRSLWLETVFRFSVNAVNVNQLSDYVIRFLKCK